MSRKFLAETNPHLCEAACGCGAVNRRSVFAGAAGAAVFAGLGSFAFASRADEASVNLAKVATPSTSFQSGDSKVSAINDGALPASSADTEKGMYGNWPHKDTQWVQ
jgi:hypothetical protein